MLKIVPVRIINNLCIVAGVSMLFACTIFQPKQVSKPHGDVVPKSSSPATHVETIFDFDKGGQNWIAGFADLPSIDQDHYELKSGLKPLPLSINDGADQGAQKLGLYLSGSNRSDDLFMYYRIQLEGLLPRAVYTADFEMDLQTKEGIGCVGAGGAPGESVFVKAGASTIEPKSIESNGYLRLSVDKGNQAKDGTAASVIGDLAANLPCSGSLGWRNKTLYSKKSISVKTDDRGKLWLFFGTDSGYEGITEVYYSMLKVKLVPIKKLADEPPTCKLGNVVMWPETHFFHRAKITEAKTLETKPSAELKLIINQQSYPSASVENVKLECGFVSQLTFSISKIGECSFYQPISMDNPDACWFMLEQLQEFKPTPERALCFIEHDQNSNIHKIEPCE